LSPARARRTALATRGAHTTPSQHAAAVPATRQRSTAPAIATTTASTSTSLSPLLLATGLVAAVATFCLLLVASRPEPGG
jgi:hypothetical protein